MSATSRRKARRTNDSGSPEPATNAASPSGPAATAPPPGREPGAREPSSAGLRKVLAMLRPRILDRYLAQELAGPFLFGLSAFTLIMAATLILSTSKLVAEEHAPLWAAIQYFFVQVLALAVFVVPLSILLGTLLALQRLSGESEIIAMKAGGIGLARVVAPLLVVGLIASVVTLVIQEGLVPLANDRATYLREEVIKHVGTLVTASNTISTSLPDGGRQITFFTGYDPAAYALLHVTVIKYDRSNRPQFIIFTERARYGQTTWTFDGADEYRFSPDGTTFHSYLPTQEIDIGEQPTQIERRVASDNPDQMSRAQIRAIIASGQLSPAEVRVYDTAYAEKLARPFGAFVFTLIAIPFGLRPTRGSNMGLGFTLAILIGFAYYVVATVASGLSTQAPDLPFASVIAAWFPNVLFTAIGVLMLRRVARI